MAAVALRSTASGMSDDRLGWYLWNFEQWYFDEGVFVGTGAGRSGISVESRYVLSQEFDAMYIAVCRRSAEAVDAIVDGLPRAQRTAFYVKHCDLVLKVVEFREPLEARYERARQAVRQGLKSRGFE